MGGVRFASCELIFDWVKKMEKKIKRNKRARGKKVIICK
jgi:hypothetical protein